MASDTAPRSGFNKPAPGFVLSTLVHQHAEQMQCIRLARRLLQYFLIERGRFRQAALLVVCECLLQQVLGAGSRHYCFVDHPC